MSCRNKKQIFWDNLREIQEVKRRQSVEKFPFRMDVASSGSRRSVTKQDLYNKWMRELVKKCETQTQGAHHP